MATNKAANGAHRRSVSTMLGFVRTLLWPSGGAQPSTRLDDEGAGPTVLVAEPTSKISASLASILRRTFPAGTVFATASEREALEVVRKHRVHIAVVDLDLGEGSGTALVREISRSAPQARCVVATIHDDNDTVGAALAAGACGYLLKSQPASLLVEQLQLLARGIPPLAPSVAQKLAGHFASTHRKSARDRAPVADDLAGLSDREEQVLRLIAKGMQMAEVASLLDISVHTVCTHVKSIYRKRQLSSRAEAALEAHRLGLV